MSVRAPLCIELYAGSFGWSRGWLKMGGRAIGFDWEHHPWHGPVPENAELVLQDVRTLNGAQFADADLILASPPCQEFSYRAMPWKRAKVIPPDELGKEEPEWWGKTEAGMTREERREWDCWKREHPRERPLLGQRLFWRCFQIQAEASEAAGRYIPMVVENVRGAQKWVGPAKANFGSFFLWGDVGMVGNRIVVIRDGLPDMRVLRMPGKARLKKNPDGTDHPPGSWFGIADSKERGAQGQKRDGRNFHAFEDGLGSSPSFNGGEHETRGVATKNDGGSWFAVANNTESGHSQNPVNGLKRPGRTISPGFNNWPKDAEGDYCFDDGRKIGGDWFSDPASTCLKLGSRSQARKAASAAIAIIPPAISRHIAECFWPSERERYQPQPTPEAEKSGNEEVDFLWKWICIPCGKRWDGTTDERGLISSAPCPGCGSPDEPENRLLTYDLVARTVPASV